MEIKYFGDGKLFIKGKKESLWLNPESGDLGKKETESRILIFTDKERNFVKTGEEENRVVVCGPGEYEIGGIEISGINSMYSINVDGVKVVTVGRVEGELSEKKKEKLEEADVLLVALGKDAVDIAKKSAANYIVPMNYKGEEKSLEEFLDAFDREKLEAVESLKVEKDSLPEGMEVVLLKMRT